MLSQVVAATIVILTSAFLALKMFTSSSSKTASLDSIPSAHFTAPYSSYWLIWQKYNNNEHRARHAAHKRLGPVVRLAPDEISVNCLEDGLQTVYGSFEKTRWYGNFLNYGLTFLFAMGPNKMHTERKKMLSHVYTKSHILNSTTLTNILDTMTTTRLLPQMKAWSKLPSLNIHQKSKAFVMDACTAYFYGLKNSTNILENPEPEGLLWDFEWLTFGVFWFTHMPGLAAFGRRFGLQLPDNRTFIGHHNIEQFGLVKADAAKVSYLASSNGDRDDNTLASTKEDLDDYPVVYANLREKMIESKTVTEKDLDVTIAAELNDHVFAAQEGTGITQTYLMVELARNPKALAKLQEELADLPENPTAQDIEGLPYLQALFMETMRVWPGNYGPFPRYVPVGGARLGEFIVPGGTIVSASIYSLHRNEDVFPDAETWNPERWLDASAEGKIVMNKWFWNFGSGGRSCIGNHLAMRVMKAFAVTVYQNFEVELVPESKFVQVESLIGSPENHEVIMRVVEKTLPKK